MTWFTVSLTMLVGSLGFSPPLDLDLPPRPRPQPTPKPPGKRDPAVVREMVPRIVKLTAAIDRLPDLSPASIEKVMGKSLGPPNTDADGYSEYQLGTAEGPFDRVYLRCAAAGAPDRSFILVLTLRAGIYLKPSDFDARLIGPLGAANPDEAGGKTVIHLVQRPGQKRHFIFRMATEALLSVVFYRGSATQLF